MEETAPPDSPSGFFSCAENPSAIWIIKEQPKSNCLSKLCIQMLNLKQRGEGKRDYWNTWSFVSTESEQSASEILHFVTHLMALKACRRILQHLIDLENPI